MAQARPLDEADPLRPYLTYSFGVHAVAAALLALRGLPSLSPPSSSVYTIDFVGPSTTIVTTGAAGAAAPQASAAATKPARGSIADFLRHPRHIALPKPSLLSGYVEKSVSERKPVALPQGSQTAAKASPPGEAAATGVATDLPNFPYPWYISQVRVGLWNQWAAKRPRQAGEAVVVFSIMPDGSVVDLRIEESSGDSAFDLAALGAAQDAAAFPPLPKSFSEPFLKIHVTLKSQ